MSHKLFFSSAVLWCFYGVPVYAHESSKTVKPTKVESAEHGRFGHWIRTLRYGYDPYYYDPYYDIYGYNSSYYYPYYPRHRFYYGYPRRPRPHIWTAGMGYNDY